MPLAGGLPKRLTFENGGVLVLGWTAWRVRQEPLLGHLHGTARNLALVLGAQIVLGIATVFLRFPLAIAVLHNAGAAALVLLVTMLNYKVQYQLAAAAPARLP